jgi:hypothetical protein
VPVDLLFQSIGAEDGSVFETSETSDVGGVVNGTGDNLQIGDHLSDRQAKGVLSFDTSAIPDEATIVAAVVRLRRVGVWGTSPFTDLGACAVDVQRGAFGGDPTLQASDFEVVATASAAAALSSAAANGEWSSAALDPGGLAAINPTGRTQIRLAFTLDDNDNGLVDRIRYASGEHADVASRPELIVSVLQ